MIRAVPNNNGNGGAHKAPAKERRGSARYPFAGAASVVDAESSARVIARASDISLGGCYIDAISCFPQGTMVWLRVTRDKQSFTTKAVVVWNRNGLGMSLAFVSTEPEQLWTVTKWIESLQEMVPANEPEPEIEAVPGPRERQAIESAIDQEPHEILKYLILMLVQKGVLNETEGATLLQRLLS